MPANETVRKNWTYPRGIVATDDTLVDAAADTFMFEDIIAGAFRPDSMMNAIEIAFTMAADGEACAAFVYAARDNGDIVLVWDGTLTAGKQEATSGRFYVDTLGSTTDNWITTIKEVDVGGGDRMSRIIFDTCGYKYFFTQFTGLSSEDVQALYSGF
jgi:hypothetical protein